MQTGCGRGFKKAGPKSMVFNYQDATNASMLNASGCLEEYTKLDYSGAPAAQRAGEQSPMPTQESK